MGALKKAVQNRHEYSTKRYSKYLMCLFGALIYSAGISLFISPAGLYSGGVMGISQLLREYIVTTFKPEIAQKIDIAGIIYYIINIPLLFLAYFKLSKRFFLKTLLATTAITISMSVMKLDGMVLLDDTLASAIVGGIIAGVGCGFMFRAGGSGAGIDILAMYLAQKYRNMSVGKISVAVNFAIYGISAIVYTPAIAIYSIICAFLNAQAVDRVHHQNIMTQVFIVTKIDNLAKPIMEGIGRGVTEWSGDGAYTKEDVHILMTMVSKYELPTVRRIAKKYDEHAFIVYNSNTGIDGNFKKKLVE